MHHGGAKKGAPTFYIVKNALNAQSLVAKIKPQKRNVLYYIILNSS